MANLDSKVNNFENSFPTVNIRNGSIYGEINDRSNRCRYIIMFNPPKMETNHNDSDIFSQLSRILNYNKYINAIE